MRTQGKRHYFLIALLRLRVKNSRVRWVSAFTVPQDTLGPFSDSLSPQRSGSVDQGWAQPSTAVKAPWTVLMCIQRAHFCADRKPNSGSSMEPRI